MPLIRPGLIFGLIAVLLTACNDGAREFQVAGVVHEVKNGGAVLIIDHEEIPDYMAAMVMPFRVAETEQTTEVEPGDVVNFTYVVEETSSWIQNLKRTGEKREVVTLEDPQLEEGEEPPRIYEVGEELPNFQLLDETGTPVNLTDYRGKPVAMTFVFSRCPVPEYCPMMMRNFAFVDEELKNGENPVKDYQLLTISFDVFNDTPEVMANYGAIFGHEPENPNWRLLTDKTCCTVREIAGQVGLKYGETKNGSYQHNLRTVVLDAEGKITRIFTDESWEVDQLVAEIRKLAP